MPRAYILLYTNMVFCSTQRDPPLKKSIMIDVQCVYSFHCRDYNYTHRVAYSIVSFVYRVLKLTYISSLGGLFFNFYSGLVAPYGDIVLHGSTLVQLMAWCLTAPGHFLYQYWFSLVTFCGIHSRISLLLFCVTSLKSNEKISQWPMRWYQHGALWRAPLIHQANLTFSLLGPLSF